MDMEQAVIQTSLHIYPLRNTCRNRESISHVHNSAVALSVSVGWNPGTEPVLHVLLSIRRQWRCFEVPPSFFAIESTQIGGVKVVGSVFWRPYAPARTPLLPANHQIMKCLLFFVWICVTGEYCRFAEFMLDNPNPHQEWWELGFDTTYNL